MLGWGAKGAVGNWSAGERLEGISYRFIFSPLPFLVNSLSLQMDFGCKGESAISNGKATTG